MTEPPITGQCLALPEAAERWWHESVRHGHYQVVLTWDDGELELAIGGLQTTEPLFRYAPQPLTETAKKLTEALRGPDRWSYRLAQCLTRAGWMRPQLDPAALFQLVELRAQGDQRVEFIFDTNALVEGIGHWLVALFADRCDLVTTAVTLSELQDNHPTARFSEKLSGLEKKLGDALGARQVYLAANRFRELPGAWRPVWRELEVDDTALLLASGQRQGNKSAAADTMLLRAVRRSINDRVRRLRRFFVTNDVALARRALMELPQDSVIAARVRDLVDEAVYAPCLWWPGVDEGSATSRSSCMRLVWELLAVADAVELRAVNGDEVRYVFNAFAHPMWPSSYEAPWIQVREHLPERQTPDSPMLAEHPVPPVAPLHANLRFGVERLLAILSTLATSPDDAGTIVAPAELRELAPSTRNDLLRLVEGLELARIDPESLVMRPGSQWPRLRAAWRSGSRDALSAVLRPFTPFAEQLDHAQSELPRRPAATRDSARRLALALGQLGERDGEPCRGGANPTMVVVREAVERYLGRVARRVPVHELLCCVFLEELEVSPVRALEAWERMTSAGVFARCTFGTGSSPSGLEQQVVELHSNGYSIVGIALDEVPVRGYRDVALAQ